MRRAKLALVNALEALELSSNPIRLLLFEVVFAIPPRISWTLNAQWRMYPHPQDPILQISLGITKLNGGMQQSLDL
jgi:hypothetical protein